MAAALVQRSTTSTSTGGRGTTSQQTAQPGARPCGSATPQAGSPLHPHHPSRFAAQHASQQQRQTTKLTRRCARCVPPKGRSLSLQLQACGHTGQTQIDPLRPSLPCVRPLMLVTRRGDYPRALSGSRDASASPELSLSDSILRFDPSTNATHVLCVSSVTGARPVLRARSGGNRTVPYHTTSRYKPQGVPSLTCQKHHTCISFT